ncbi:MAG: Antitoxin Phd YefM, type toxin-antitoxin system [Acidobacteriota bacterium]|jgi:prevent-host-death family protein|nr:Antitoxin Phd YefM, type toxin-antitoxin system [Acidobacteriota bacterium]
MSKTVQRSELGPEFAAIVDRVTEGQEELVVTKDGRSIAKVVPIGDLLHSPMAGSVLFEGDIISPIEEAWDAAR